MLTSSSAAAAAATTPEIYKKNSHFRAFGAGTWRRRRSVRSRHPGWAGSRAAPLFVHASPAPPPPPPPRPLIPLQAADVTEHALKCLRRLLCFCVCVCVGGEVGRHSADDAVKANQPFRCHLSPPSAQEAEGKFFIFLFFFPVWGTFFRAAAFL